MGAINAKIRRWPLKIGIFDLFDNLGAAFAARFANNYCTMERERVDVLAGQTCLRSARSAIDASPERVYT